MDRVSGYEPEGQRFESSPVRFLHSFVLSFHFLHVETKKDFVTILVHTFVSGPFSTNSYILELPGQNHVIMIDTPPGIDRKVEPFLESRNLVLQAIYLTHSHWDHTAGYLSLALHRSIPLFIHKEDEENLIHPGSDGLPAFIPIQPITVAHLLFDGETFSFGPLSFTVLHTPGHSHGSSCFYCKEEGLLFTGDTLFKGTYGNTSFPKSSPDLMRESLLFLASLPKNTRIFPGHGPQSRLSEEEGWIRKSFSSIL